MAKQNLLQETLTEFRFYGLSESDVIAVEVNGDFASWEVFKKCAKDYTYDSRCGRLDVSSDIRIIGKNFIMYRQEWTDDSSEWNCQIIPENIVVNPDITEIHFQSTNNMSKDFS